jgi:DNA polymerase III alpha subunit
MRWQNQFNYTILIVVALVQKYGMMLEKYPNQRSMHSCGILISEEPITNYTVLEMPPKGFSLHCLTCTLLKILVLKNLIS